MRSGNSEDELGKIAAIAVSLYMPAPRHELVSLMQEGMNGAELQPHLSSDKWRAAQRICSECQHQNIQVVPIVSARYPYRLHQVPAPPPVLYVRSGSPEWAPPEAMLAVVGTRTASVEMCGFATEIAKSLSSGGFWIVSGLALGVDGAAHRGSLLESATNSEKAGGTIAVLAHGLDKVYPPTHEPLAEQILAQGGALISEYPPGTPAFKHHFLARNRVIAGLSQGVVVIQAGARSGSLVTARFGADFGRDVFVYQPQRVDERHSGGAQMIEDGAIPFVDVARILMEYGVTHQGAAGGAAPADSREMGIDEFLALHRLTPSQLLKLELEDKVVRLPGNRVRAKVALR